MSCQKPGKAAAEAGNARATRREVGRRDSCICSDGRDLLDMSRRSETAEGDETVSASRR
jgi:hypothetical protein